MMMTFAFLLEREERESIKIAVDFVRSTSAFFCASLGGEGSERNALRVGLNVSF